MTKSFLAKDQNYLVSFSGPDGSGKSTQIALLKAELEGRGIETVVLWTRLGYTPGFEWIKYLLRKFLGKKLPARGSTKQRTQMMARSDVRVIWMSIALFDLLITAAIRVRIHKFRGRAVICDRWIWDSFIDRRLYHGGAPFIDRIIGPIFRTLSARPCPAILLMLPLDESKRRSEDKDEPFPDTPKVRAARHLEYEKMNALSGFLVIDASQPAQAIASRIVAAL